MIENVNLLPLTRSFDFCSATDARLVCYAWIQWESTTPFTLLEHPLYNFALVRIEAVKQAVVWVKTSPHGQKYLVAFVQLYILLHLERQLLHIKLDMGRATPVFVESR